MNKKTLLLIFLLLSFIPFTALAQTITVGGRVISGEDGYGLPGVTIHIPDRQKEVLFAIADAGKAEKIMGTQFIRRYSLPSASAVQSSVRKLMETDYVTFFEGVYSIPDVLFRMYLKRIGGKE